MKNYREHRVDLLKVETSNNYYPERHSCQVEAISQLEYFGSLFVSIQYIGTFWILFQLWGNPKKSWRNQYIGTFFIQMFWRYWTMRHRGWGNTCHRKTLRQHFLRRVAVINRMWEKHAGKDTRTWSSLTQTSMECAMIKISQCEVYERYIHICN